MGPGIWGSPQHSPSYPVTLQVPFTQASTETFTGIHTCVPAHGQGACEPGMGQVSGMSVEKEAPPSFLPMCVLFPEDLGSWLLYCPLSSALQHHPACLQKFSDLRITVFSESCVLNPITAAGTGVL